MNGALSVIVLVAPMAILIVAFAVLRVRSERADRTPRVEPDA